ncbi:GDP-fucose protein O-fucosyltransferase 2 [Trichonephila clavata]|uniref:GDP-fucose protein O-fucosyltransferase 2 n=1 Tax=Trichonephila clavata TaxID=2740835 RepID=A0A8X6KFX3_TRICU|nr:GDP-fucose protein O-fucosyltransferase 2 [Trichonephila clavata]
MNLRILFILLYCTCVYGSEFCDADQTDNSCGSSASNSYMIRQKYLIYDVNPGEGFNLRRDVYMRMANVVRKLNEVDEKNNWVLVLPPWGPLYHWKSRKVGFQAQIKWEKFFNVSSLKRYVPVIELEEFITENGYKIESFYYLQHYAEGWTDSGWEERYDIRDCIEPPPYERTRKGTFSGWFWGYDNMFAEKFQCLSIQGYSSTLASFLKMSSASIIMIDRAEVILHNDFGSVEYWTIRRSIKFAKKLIDIGDSFRKFHFNSTDENDKIKNYDSLNSPIKRDSVGGPYISVHLRRQDFAQSRPKDVPSISYAAKQILKHMKRLNLQYAFIATDASQSEFEELQQYIPGAIRFSPSFEVLKDILDGGVAIVDQWICAHARYFLGTHESTFSFRIQEEREILGFPVETTFNKLCSENQTICTQPSKWTIAF